MNKCSKCGKYTLASTCKDCDAGAHTPHPPKFSPEDKYGKYRRKLKEMSERGD